MIVSFEKKFIFVAIPKTAGHSIRAGLRPLMGSKDWEQCGLFEKKSFPVTSLADFGHGHLTAAQIKSHLPPGTYQTFFSFAFVRNPYDRFVSFNAFVNRSNSRMQRDPLGTMIASFENPQLLNHTLMRPQHEFVCDHEGIMVNHIALYEDIQSEFDDIRSRIANAQPFLLPKVNSSTRTCYADYFNDTLQQLVWKHYERDFELFGYSRGLN